MSRLTLGFTVALILFCAFCTHTASGLAVADDGAPSGDVWNETDIPYDFMESSVCTIDRVSADVLSADMFARVYLERQPVIIRQTKPLRDNLQLRRVLQKRSLLALHGEDTITLSTGNRNSYRKKDVLLAEYVAGYMAPQSLSQRGNETWYHFGDPHHLHWREIQALYQPPKAYMAHMLPSLSFGVAPSGSGVPFHVHGHVFAEVFYGRKRWWIASPLHEPRFDPDASSLQWLQTVRPTYMAAEEASLMECVCEVGDIIYIPTGWFHATLNLGESVFISVFV